MDYVTVKVYTLGVGQACGEGEIVGWSTIEVWYIGLDHVDVEGLLNQKISINSLFSVCYIQVIMLLEFPIYTYIYIAYMLSLPASMIIHNALHISFLINIYLMLIMLSIGM